MALYIPRTRPVEAIKICGNVDDITDFLGDAFVYFHLTALGYRGSDGRHMVAPADSYLYKDADGSIQWASAERFASEFVPVEGDWE